MSGGDADLGAALRAVPLPVFAVAAAGIVALDVWLERRDEQPHVVPLALADWSAHLATTALALRALPAPAADRIAGPALAATLLIDLDHVPIALAIARKEDLPRPRTHTFATPLALAAAGRRAAAFGVAVHLARDLFNGPGVRGLRLPVWAEAAGLGALLALAARRRLS